MKVRNALMAGAAAVALAAGSFAPAKAVTIPFASFLYNGPTKVNYDNATGTLSGTNIEIVGTYLNAAPPVTVKNGAATGTNYSALLSFTATRNGNATAIGGGFLAQDFNLSSFNIQLVTAISGGLKNFLSGSANPASVVGKGTVGGATSSLSGGGALSFASDYLNFMAPPTDQDLSWTLQSITPGLSISGNNFATFSSTVTGSFGYNSVPEPGAVATLCGLGVSSSIFVLRRRRK